MALLPLALTTLAGGAAGTAERALRSATPPGTTGAASRTTALERLAAARSRAELDAARAALEALPGVGAWTSAEVARVAFGDPDALSLHDFHLPNLVSWTLAGEPRGTDERMLELLEPYRGQRGRVQRLLEAGGVSAPRYGPRQPLRSIARI